MKRIYILLGVATLLFLLAGSSAFLTKAAATDCEKYGTPYCPEPSTIPTSTLPTSSTVPDTKVVPTSTAPTSTTSTTTTTTTTTVFVPTPAPTKTEYTISCETIVFTGGQHVSVETMNGALVWKGVPPHTVYLASGQYNIIIVTAGGNFRNTVTVPQCVEPDPVPPVDQPIQGELHPPNGAPICEQYPNLIPHCLTEPDTVVDTMPPTTATPPPVGVVLPETM